MTRLARWSRPVHYAILFLVHRQMFRSLSAVQGVCALIAAALAFSLARRSHRP